MNVNRSALGVSLRKSLFSQVVVLLGRNCVKCFAVPSHIRVEAMYDLHVRMG
jgi:hypothetical protein